MVNVTAMPNAQSFCQNRAANAPPIVTPIAVPTKRYADAFRVLLTSEYITIIAVMAAQ